MSRKAHQAKSRSVKMLQGYSPDEVSTEGELIEVMISKNHPEQKIEYYWFNNYGWTVVVDIATDRLITAYPNRKIKERP